MYTVISALGDTPAAEGIGGALISFLAIVGTLALIYAVLEIMAHVRRKKDNGENAPEAETKEPPAKDKNFGEVLREEIKKHDDGDGDLRA